LVEVPTITQAAPVPSAAVDPVAFAGSETSSAPASEVEAQKVNPEAAETLNPVSSSAPTALDAVVAELESAAATTVAEKPAAAAPTVSTEAPSSQSSENTNSKVETPAVESAVIEQTTVRAQKAEERPVEAKSEDVRIASAESSEPEATPDAAVGPAAVSEAQDQIRAEAEKLKDASPVASQSHHDESTPEEPAREESKVPVEEPVRSTSLVEAPIARALEVREDQASERKTSEPIRASAGRNAGGVDEMAKRESDTAAAWASWRKIRETGSAKPGQSESSLQASDESSPRDEAAMAVAAGAERTPEDGAIESDPEIASIVDSVLADMRPKIVEEIARKLGKKK
jgi:ribonuclease E